jgi:hypothetical protein
MMKSLPARIAFRATALLSILVLWIGVCTGQEPAEQPAELRAAHLARMKELAGSFQVLAVPGRKDSQAKLVAEPVLRYSDNTRKQYDESSLWIFGAQGRPSAIVAIEFYVDGPKKEPAWLYEIASLSVEKIAAERGDTLQWTAKGPGLPLAPIEGAPPPADKPIRRLAQMKGLRQRFAAHEHSIIEGRIELRPLTSPLYRYEDAASNIIDGAIFSFANGTNPEVLLVLEAHQTKDSSEWRYGLVQMAGAELIVHLDGKQVWDRPNADPPAVRDSYVNGWIAAEMREPKP